MEIQNSSDIKIRKRIFIGVIVLAIGILGLRILLSLKKPPAEKTPEESVIKVDVQKMFRKDVPVTMTSFGETRPLNTVLIAPEVPGKVVEIHKNLEVGGIIKKGETLFKIDSRDYLIEYNYSKERLKSLERSFALSKADYERVKRLFVSEKVESQSRVDMAEQSLNSSKELVDRLKQAIEIAELRLERCHVRAPFDSRIVACHVEENQYVAPGVNVLTIADDSMLEIHVSLESGEVRKWLRFMDVGHNNNTAWFRKVEPVNCKVKWTEDPDNYIFPGKLDRIVKFDRTTRMMTVSVKVNGTDASNAGNGKLSLVSGMFCSVEISGKTLENVYQVPRWAVTYENTVYISQDNRLKTVNVDLLYTDGENAYIAGGINEGDLLIITRLSEPLENSLLLHKKSEPAQPEAEEV